MTPADPQPIREVGENRIVARFRQMAGAGEGVVVGPGDDTAVLSIPGDRLALFACDMMVEGIHFRQAWATPEQIGWKAMAQNLSDIAAMGGEPGFAVASVAAPGGTDERVVEGIARGLNEAARRYGSTVVGGDLVGSPGPLVVDVAVLGWVEAALVLRREGARPGDVVLVTGTLGASAAGLAACQGGLREGEDEAVARARRAHHQPEPRVPEGRAIAATRRATAMMDVSDGLSEDLPRLCGESGVGARVFADRIPVDAACRAVAVRLGLDALELASSGGEDYELLLTCPESAVEALAAAVSAHRDTSVSVIGEIVARPGVVLVDTQGRERALAPGFDHFAGEKE